MIKKLTREQELQIPKYIEKWVAKASEPVDREKTVKIVKELFGEDKTVLIAESLDNCTDIIKFIASGKDIKYSSQLDSQLYSQLSSTDINYSYYTTIWWYNWYGYYDYAKYIGVKFDEEKFNRMGAIILNIPLIVTLGQILIVMEKPKVRWNKNGFIHSDEFPAIEWTDKSGIYFLNGVKFPKELWEKVVSHSMSLKEVMAIVDIDQRTQAMKYVDVQELIKEFKGETLSTYSKFTVDGKEVSYSLVKIPKNDNLFTIDSYHAVYKCPSTDKVYMSGIDPKIAEKGDIKEAMAWKGKMTVEQWQTLIPLVTES